MPTAENCLRILYVSRIATAAPFGMINEIVSYARLANPVQRITGALLFDGEHFCQLIEGPDSAVRTLAQRIYADTRHTDATELLQTEMDRASAMRGWRSGYCEAEQLDVFMGPQGMRGEAALAVFFSVLSGADLD